jgi:hypothetical protein
MGIEGMLIVGRNIIDHRGLFNTVSDDEIAMLKQKTTLITSVTAIGVDDCAA